MSSEDAQELPRIPELEADYELIRELGRGGTAVVFLARERQLGRHVAIKLIRPRYVQDDDAVARLVREARTAARLQHPNIVMLLGARRLGQRELALILQFVPGITLKERIQMEGALPYADAERILVDVGRALAYAHRHRIVHRDIKPENIYLDEESGLARLADFGIARVWDSDSGLTMPGTAIGTPAYMSPEQVDGCDLDGRSDLFSLGLVAYEMFTGERPWAGEGLYNIIYKQKHEELPPLAERCPGLPARISNAIGGALKKNPDERWHHAEEFLAVLQGTSVSSTEWDSPLDAEPGSAIAGLGPGPPPERDRTGPPLEDDKAGLRLEDDKAGPPLEDDKTILYRRPSIGGPPAPGPGQVERSEDREGTTQEFEALRGQTAQELEAIRQATAQDAGGRRGAARRPSRGSPAPAWLRARKGRPGGATEPEGWPPSGSVAPEWLEEAVAEGPARSTRGSFLRRQRGSLLGRIATVRGGALFVLIVLAAVAAWLLSPWGQDHARALSARLGPLLGAAGAVGTGPTPNPPLSREPDATGLDGGAADLPSAVARSGRPALLDTGTEAMGALLPGTELPADPRGRVQPAGVLVVGERTRIGMPGRPLPEPVAFRVVDERGNGVPGVEVSFEVASGGGSVRPARAVTGAAGTVSTAWTLGAGAGVQALRAQVSGTGDADIVAEIIAQIAAEAGEGAAQLAVEGAAQADSAPTAADAPSIPAAIQLLQGSGQEAAPGMPLPRPLEVRVTDALGRPVAGVAVTFVVMAGGGTVDPVIIETSTRGIARAGWTLGPQQGRQDVRVVVEGSPSLEATFVATASAPRLAIRPEVTAGGTHSCWLQSDGSLVCWGSNESGQLGDGSRTRRLAPGSGVDGAAFAAVATGVSHTCALSTNGRISCWGLNSSGQLGDGTTTSRASPVSVTGGRAFVAVTAGAAHTCALTATGVAYCWGANDHGQLGNGSTRQSTTPARVEAPGQFTDIVAGWHHTCALDEEGAAYCWGLNESGQAGTGGGQAVLMPTLLVGGHRFENIAAGSGHSCGLTGQGEILCWGANGHGQLGDGTHQSRTTPVPVFDRGPFVMVVAGGIHSCGLTDGGTLRCWGGNLYGQLGDGSTSDRSTPVPVAGDIHFTQVHALGSHTCGRTPLGEILCWGYNVEGQLGDGTRENRSVPTPVIGFDR